MRTNPVYHFKVQRIYVLDKFLGYLVKFLFEYKFSGHNQKSAGFAAQNSSLFVLRQTIRLLIGFYS